MLSFAWFFLFDQAKNNAVLEPRKGHFRGLVGFEAKAKDLSFEAKAKDLKMCPRGLPRGQGLYLYLLAQLVRQKTFLPTFS